MAHEISHVAARHGMRQMTRAHIAQYRTIPLIFVGGGIGYGIYEAAGLGLPLTFMKFQRNFEAEADYLGLQYMYKTGYDPQAFISFFEKIQAKRRRSRARSPRRSHRTRRRPTALRRRKRRSRPFFRRGRSTSLPPRSLTT
jgi:predicted Zn-dependent protease